LDDQENDGDFNAWSCQLFANLKRTFQEMEGGWDFLTLF